MFGFRVLRFRDAKPPDFSIQSLRGSSSIKLETLNAYGMGFPGRNTTLVSAWLGSAYSIFGFRALGFGSLGFRIHFGGPDGLGFSV